MQCYFCASQKLSITAVALCQRCGAAACKKHICEVDDPQKPIGMVGFIPAGVHMVCLRCMSQGSERTTFTNSKKPKTGNITIITGTTDLLALQTLKRSQQAEQIVGLDDGEGEELSENHTVIQSFETFLRRRRKLKFFRHRLMPYVLGQKKGTPFWLALQQRVVAFLGWRRSSEANKASSSSKSSPFNG